MVKEKIQLGKLYECPKCDKRVTNLQNHMKVHSEGKEVCTVCSGKFKQSGSLKRHMVQIHNIIEGDIGNYQKKYEDPKILENCNVCGKAYNKYALKKHMLIHETQTKKCEYCPENFKASVYIRHLMKAHKKTGKCLESKAKTNEKVYLNCKFCGKLMLKESLRDHEVYHKEDIKFECDVCGAKIKHKPSFDRHMVQVHGLEIGQTGSYTKKYKSGKKECHICCKEVSSFSYHKKMHHSDEPPLEKNIKCESCGKMFQSKTKRKYHVQQVHEEKYDYECKLCD